MIVEALVIVALATGIGALLGRAHVGFIVGLILAALLLSAALSAR